MYSGTRRHGLSATDVAPARDLNSARRIPYAAQVTITAPLHDAVSTRATLDPSVTQIHEWLEQVNAHVCEILAKLDSAHAAGVTGPRALEIANDVSVAIPELPNRDALTHALEIIDTASQAALFTPGPGYLAYIPGGGLVAAAIADLIANVYNRFTGLTAAAAGFCRLEADVLTWLAAEFGLPASASGLLTTGGSMANFSAIVAARHRSLGESGDFRHARAYTSIHAHHSVAKSLRLAGLPATALTLIPCDQAMRLSVADLARAIETDRAAGLRPFLVIAAAGTTNTGAVDPLLDLAELCRAHELWFHVDGAYGGSFVLCEEGKRRLAGIELADSITFDPHKGMFLPYGTGALLVRDGATLRNAHHVDAEYLQDLRAGSPEYSPHEYGPELSRDFRGLRLWLPLMLHGARAFRNALAEKLALAHWLYLELQHDEGIELLGEPQLSIVAMRLRHRDGESVDDWNARNERWLEAINARGNVFLSSTMLDAPPPYDRPLVTLRVCVLSFRTEQRHIEACAHDLRDTAAALS